MSTLVWPNGTTTPPNFSDGYGPRPPVAIGVRPFHCGADYFGIGRLRAIGAGTVVEVGWLDWAGWYVLIYLGEIDGERTWVRYCHLASKSHLNRGDYVALGDLVGFEGDTGLAFGVHLHLEINRGGLSRGGWTDGGHTVDPTAFIRAHLNNRPAPSPEEAEEEMFIANINGSFFLIVPQGSAKPRAVVLGADSGAGGSGIPIIKYTWQKSIDQLKRAVDGL